MEQPRSSMFKYHDRFQEIIKKFRVYSVDVYLGAYGSPTEKPVIING